MKKFIALLMITTVAACAKSPGSIEPAGIAPYAYSNMTCPQLRREHSILLKEQAKLERKQSSTATIDTVSVVLVLLPLGSIFGGDKAGELSIAKGKVVAIENVIRARKCE